MFSDDVLKKIVPDFIAFIIQFSVFIILCLLVMFFIYKPIKKILKKRNDYIEHCLKNNAENEKKSKEMLQKIEQRLLNIDDEAKIILKKAENESIQKAKNMILETEKICKEKMNIFEEKINREIKNKNDEINKIIIETAYNMCVKVLKNKTTKKDDKERLNNFIVELENEQKNNIK